MWSGLVETNFPLALLLVGSFVFILCWWHYHYRKEELFLQLRIVIRELERDEFRVTIVQKGARRQIVLENRWAQVEYEAHPKHEQITLNLFFQDAKSRGGNLTQLTRFHGKEGVRHYAPITFSRDHGMLGSRFYSVSSVVFGKTAHDLVDRIKELLFAHQEIQ